MLSAPQWGHPGSRGRPCCVSAGGRRGALGRARPGQQEPQASLRLRHQAGGQGVGWGALLRAEGLTPCLRPDRAGQNPGSRQPHVAPDTDSGNSGQKGKEAAGRARPVQVSRPGALGHSVRRCWAGGRGVWPPAAWLILGGRPPISASAPPSTPETRGHLPAGLSWGHVFTTAPPRLRPPSREGPHPPRLRPPPAPGTTPSCSWPSPGPHRWPRWCLPAWAPGGIIALARLTAAPGWPWPAPGFQNLLCSC